MGKMNELSQVITELRNCGNALVNIADSLQEIFSAPANEPAVDAAVQKAHNEKEAPAPAKPALTFIDVRKVLAERSRAGHIKALLQKYGADTFGKPLCRCCRGSRGAVMPGQHALLSPSSAHRWLNCPPSAKLCAAQEDTTSVYAQQGTDAHELCQYKLEKALGLDTKDPTENLTYYDEEMETCAVDYASFVMETLSKIKETCPDPVVLIEQRLDFSRFVPQGFGRGDCVIIADGTMHVIDFKYGLGVLVSAENNPQMLCYALGALELLDSLYEFGQISMTIFQPRRDNISTSTISKDKLLAWAENTLAPTAKLAYEGKGEFKAGDHCQFCKIMATCRKRAEYNLEMAHYDFEMPVNLDHTEIAAILAKADQLSSWVDDVKEYALAEALRGTHFDGYKVVAGRSNRKYADESAAAAAVIAAGADPYEKKLLGITAMTALLGKKKFEEILGGLVIKPQGKPVLVKADDKRPEYNSAINDFNE